MPKVPREQMDKSGKPVQLRSQMRRYIFNIQTNDNSHNKYIKLMQKLYRESPYEEFFNEFCHCLQVMFVQENKVKNPYVARSLRFLAAFVVSLDTQEQENAGAAVTNELLGSIINFILPFHDCAAEKIRYHVCKYINLLLVSIGNDGYLNDIICDQIRDTMLKCIEDHRASVREQAVIALQRLQDPLDPNDPVVAAYFRTLFDQNKPVRRATVECLGISMVTIPELISRSKDVDEAVRIKIYERFSAVPVKVLKVEHRQALLKNGFDDSHAMVRRKLVNVLVPRWLSFYNGDYIAFMRAVKLDADKEEIDRSKKICSNLMDVFLTTEGLRTICEVLKLDSNRLVPLESLSWEMLLFWNKLSKKLLESGEDFDELYESITPDLTKFSGYIESYLKSFSDSKTRWDLLNLNSILAEFMEMIFRYDLSEVVGRNHLHKLVTTILTELELDEKNTCDCISILYNMVHDWNVIGVEICTIISDIREPCVASTLTAEQMNEWDLETVGLRVQINIKTEELERATQRQDFITCQVLKEEMDELRAKLNEINRHYNEMDKSRASKPEGEVACKALDVLIAGLLEADSNTISKSFLPLLGSFVKPSLASKLPEVHSRALKALALFCLDSEEMAKNAIQLVAAPLLSHRYMSSCDPMTVLVAVQATTDMILVYGTQIFGELPTLSQIKKRGMRQLYCSQVDESESFQPTTASCNDVVEILTEMLDTDNCELREIAGLSLIKLIHSGQVDSPSLLTRLLLKWFNPTTARDVRLRQYLGLFFTDYPHVVPDSFGTLEKVFVRAVNGVCNAPRNSPLVDIDVDSMVHFLIELTRYGNYPDHRGRNSHNNIAIGVCKELREQPSAKSAAALIKALPRFDIRREDKAVIKQLKKDATEILEGVEEKLLRRYILKFINKLSRNVSDDEGSDVDSIAGAPKGDADSDRIEEDGASGDDNDDDDDVIIIEERSTPADALATSIRAAAAAAKPASQIASAPVVTPKAAAGKDLAKRTTGKAKRVVLDDEEEEDFELRINSPNVSPVRKSTRTSARLSGSQLDVQEPSTSGMWKVKRCQLRKSVSQSSAESSTVLNTIREVSRDLSSLDLSFTDSESDSVVISETSSENIPEECSIKACLKRRKSSRVRIKKVFPDCV